MTDSSQPQTYTIILNDNDYKFDNTTMISTSSDYSNLIDTSTITIDTSQFSNLNYGCINEITLNSWITSYSPFEDSFPDWHDFKSMCEEYPGLEKAFSNLKLFYDQVKDDWESKKKGEK